VSPRCEARDRVENHLEELVDEHDGAVFVRSREVAREVGLTPRQVGIYLGRLERDDELAIGVEKWSRSRGAWAWRVTAEE